MKHRNLLLLLLTLLVPLLASAQRDPIKWPFAKTSIWNMPIHNDAQYIFADVQPAENFEADEDVIVLTPDEPLMNVETNYTGWNAGGDARCSDQGPTLFSAPIPESFIYSPENWHGSTPNAGLAVLLPNGKIKQTQPFAKCTETLATSQFIWDENDCVLTGECIGGAHGGSGLSAIGGALRVGELSSGEIKHVLKINLWGRENFYNGDGGYRWPAPKADGGYNDPDAPNYYGGLNPEMRVGALLALHKDVVLESVENNSLGLETEPALIVARALRDYGAYTVDNTAWDTYAIITENGTQGRVSDEFKNIYGYDMNTYGGLQNSSWGRDLEKLFGNLYVISNNVEGNTGGGPVSDLNNRLASPAPDFLPSKTLKIMPLGDSKTEGGGGEGQQSSWRGFLRTKLLRNGYKIDYVGPRQNYALGDTIPNDLDHAGHGGYTIGPDTQKFCGTCETTGIFEHIQDWLPQANPDVVLLALGVNDMFGAENHPDNYAATAPQRYRNLVNKILQLKPGVKIIVGTVEPVKWNKEWGSDPNDQSLGALNAAIKAIADSSDTDNIYFADVYNSMYQTWDPGDFFDDLHLSEQGAKKDADIWFNALVPVLNNTPNNEDPSVEIISPESNSSFDAPASITLEVNATDSDGTIQKVEFYNGQNKIGETVSAPFSFEWTDVDEGTYEIIAVATDDLFASATSSSINLQVNSTDGYVKYSGSGIGSPGSFGNSGAGFEKALDGDLTSYFDGPSPDGQWVGLDLGAAKIVKKVKYAPRADWAFRINGGKIQGSNAPDFSGAVDLFTITTTPSEGVYTVARFENTEMFQYYRFLSPSNGYGNISEIEFWGDPNDPTSQAPECTLITPTSDSTYAAPANVTISATASSAVASITKVELYSGTTLLETITEFPYEFVWTDVPAGNYSITAKATDSNGLSTTSSPANIKVTGEITEESVSFKNPPMTLNPGVTYTLNIEYAALQDRVLDVYLFNSGWQPIVSKNVRVAAGSGTQQITLTVPGTTAPLTDGIWAVSLWATDWSANLKSNYVYGVSVNEMEENTAPTVNISLPADSTTFNAPATIEINATAADVDGSISKVEFYNGANLLGTVLESPFSFNWNNVPVGTYSLRAIATDNDGAATTSTSIHVSVEEEVFDESVSFENPPMVVNAGLSYTVEVNYVADAPRVIDVYLYNSSWQRIASANKWVPSGFGTASLQITIPAELASTTGGIWAVNLWAADWSSVLKSNTVFGVAINEDQGKLTLTSVCSENPLETRRWRVISTYNSPVAFDWKVYGNAQLGTGSIGPQDTVYFETATVSGANTTIVTYKNTKKETKASSGEKCDMLIAGKSMQMNAVNYFSLPEEVLVYPNPANDELSISYHTESQVAVDIEIVDMLAKVRYARSETSEKGPNRFRVSVDHLQNGVYVITLKVGNKIRDIKLLVDHQ